MSQISLQADETYMIPKDILWKLPEFRQIISVLPDSSGETRSMTGMP